MRQYIVDAFTKEAFSGNPAAVCVLDEWPSDASMMRLARENNLSETAFIVREAQDGSGADGAEGEVRYRLRWFTPGCEVELCGHATLASAFVVLGILEPDAACVAFDTMSGRLLVQRDGEQLRMDFPTYELREIPVTDAMEAAFGVRPSKAVLGLDLICVFDDESVVRGMDPNQTLLMQLPGRIQNATAAGTADADCVSRSFCPKLAIAEDPVCGSAHVQIASYWACELGKDAVRAYQASARGGWLFCPPLEGGRMAISGDAVLVAVSDIVAPL
ncbi:MAG: PhzF family phenazine biosynthesis protein [Coriobacteriales bacterium]|nr:PhzF family phenazine biosynthesis protein [Coriobacteriales bacterium]